MKYVPFLPTDPLNPTYWAFQRNFYTINCIKNVKEISKFKKSNLLSGLCCLWVKAGVFRHACYDPFYSVVLCFSLRVMIQSYWHAFIVHSTKTWKTHADWLTGPVFTNCLDGSMDFQQITRAPHLANFPSLHPGSTNTESQSETSFSLPLEGNLDWHVCDFDPISSTVRISTEMWKRLLALQLHTFLKDKATIRTWHKPDEDVLSSTAIWWSCLLKIND